jgi:hypothetical protein
MSETINSRFLSIFFFTFFLLTLWPLTSNASWLIYHKPAFEGQVIDIDTKEPVEGAVVTAYYQRTYVIGFGVGPTDFSIQETLTDKNGKFVIPSYTTLLLPIFFGTSVSIGIYKPGYAQTGEGEAVFTKEGRLKTKEYHWFPNESKLIRVHDGVFELPKLEKKEDRETAMQNSIEDLNNQKLLQKVIDGELKYLGYSPTSKP